MDYTLHRNRNRLLLGVLVLAQLLLLGYQVRRPDAGGIRLVRLWSVEAILPAERAMQRTVGHTRGWFQGYVALQAVNQRNEALESQVSQLEIQNQRLRESVRELPQLEALLKFERSYGLSTRAAQVISSGASADVQAIYLDQGSGSGLARNMAVVTPQGVVGKLSQVLSSSAQVLLVTDPDSGVGVLIGATGVHGILRGLGAGRAELRSVLKDEPLAPGAAIITSGEDQVFPKGVPVGTVTSVLASTDGVFKSATVQLAADLGRLENVLVITAAVPPPPASTDGMTAAEIRQAKLPGLPDPAAVKPGSTAWPGAGAVPAPPNTPPAEGDALGPAPASVVPGAPPAKPDAKPATPAAAKPTIPHF